MHPVENGLPVDPGLKAPPSPDDGLGELSLYLLHSYLTYTDWEQLFVKVARYPVPLPFTTWHS